MTTILNRKQSNIPFYPELINELKEEHHIIRQYLWRVRHFLEQKNYINASVAIEKLRSLGLQHVSKENIKVYAHLRLIYSDKASSEEAITLRNIRKQNDSSLLSMSYFCEEYRDLTKDEEKQKDAYSIFCSACELNLKKMLIEEKEIYPLYLKQFEIASAKETCEEHHR